MLLYKNQIFLNETEMFPIIPQRLSSSTMTQAQTNTKSTNSIKKNGIFTSSYFKKNLTTLQFDLSDLLLNKKIKSLDSKIKTSVKLKNDFIQTLSGNFEWIKLLKISNDIHSYNVILERTVNDRYLVRTVKEIHLNNELILWFSEELIHLMFIPHLSPINIQGQNRYICHKCQVIYENPNPLKIHLAIGCNENHKSPLEVLLKRLTCELHDPSPTTTSTSFWLSSPSQSPIIKNSPPPVLQQSMHPTTATLTSQTTTFIVPNYTPTTLLESKRRCSAFQPISKNSKHLNFQRKKFNEIDDTASNLETIVSNMGSSKQGHLCIYCGKLYSRKYGLKIHIRTHTGYKPLKCKYCCRPFGDPSNLNKHIRLHAQNNINYKCEICNKMLIRRRDLERHIQTRHSMELKK